MTSWFTQLIYPLSQIGNPLASNHIAPFAAPYGTDHHTTLFRDTSTPAIPSLPNTLTPPAGPDTTNDNGKCSKGARMRPTKTTTARYVNQYHSVL